MHTSLKIFAVSMIFATSAMAQQRPVFYDFATGQLVTSTNASGSTNTYFSSINVGNLNITTDGITVTNNYGWEDLRFPAGVAAPVTPNADVGVDTAENGLTFTAGAGGTKTNLDEDHVYGVAQMPHTWLTNSAVQCHVHFIQKFGDENTNWYLRWRWQPLGGVTNSDWNFTGPATNYFAFNGTSIHQMAQFTNITLNGVHSSIFDWKLYSLGTVVSNDLTFKEFDIHYQIKSVTGSKIDP